MLAEEMKHALGEMRIIDGPSERELYSHDIGDLPPFLTRLLFRNMPDFVVQPETVDDISRILIFANSKKIPVVPRGAASWGFGGVIPVKGGIVIDMSPFRKILSLDTSKKTVTVEGGARWSDIDITAKKHGLCLMTYPSSKYSTVGGWIATGGYGINSFRYGHLSKQIVSIKVVTAAGEIRQLSPSDSEFGYYIGTEGVFGILVEVTIRLRQLPAASFPHLLYFSGDGKAFTFIEQFLAITDEKKLNPNTVRFLDEYHLHDTNKLMRSGVFKETAGVIVEFSSREENERFIHYIEDLKIDEAPRHAANYLWNERLFGMKTKRLGPTILASEVTMPITSAAAFISKAKKLGNDFGVEVGIDSYITDKQEALIMATFLCDIRTLKYYMNVPLVSILTRAAVKLGAKPYGLGLWNAAFINYLFNESQLKDLKNYKTKVDPNNILNPGKFFTAGAKGAASLVFRPAIFNFLMQLLITISPVLGRIVTLFLGRNKQVDNLDYELSLHACARCGSCLAECPAYLVTGNEAVTAKGKIALARKLTSGQEVSKEEALNAFMCMHCRACEEICQTNLDLMSLWDSLEERIERRYGRPEAAINEFLAKVDESQEYWDMVDLNNLPSAGNIISKETE
ncbi:MAG: FAD-binding protein [Dehalococcoidales bacterium]|nr:FAD-binding protein [Dehalococcoidales bacterium]